MKDNKNHSLIPVLAITLLALSVYLSLHIFNFSALRVEIVSVFIILLISIISFSGILRTQHYTECESELEESITRSKEMENKLKIANMAIKEQLKETSTNLLRCNVNVEKEITGRKQTESQIAKMNMLLKLFIDKNSKKEYLDSVMGLVYGWCNCSYLGLRVSGENGAGSYESSIYRGENTREAENFPADERDYISVIKRQPGSQYKPFITESGSLLCDNIKELVNKLTEKEKTRLLNGYIKKGISSLAIIPLRYKNDMFGAIQIADEKKGTITDKIVGFIESITPAIAEAIWRFDTEENLGQKVKDLQESSYELNFARNQVKFEYVKLRNILDKIEDGVYISNRNNDIEYINPILEKEFGPVNNRKCFSYFHGRIDVCPDCNKEEVFSGKSIWRECNFAKNGKYYRLFDIPVHNIKNGVSKLEIFHDITKYKDIEQKYYALLETANGGKITVNFNRKGTFL